MKVKPAISRPLRQVGPEAETRDAPANAAAIPTASERAADLGRESDPERKAKAMRQEVDKPADDSADDMGRGLHRHDRHPGREDAGH